MTEGGKNSSNRLSSSSSSNNKSNDSGRRSLIFRSPSDNVDRKRLSVSSSSAGDRSSKTLNKKFTDKNNNGPNFWCSARFRLGILIFFGFVSSYSLRLTLNFTVVCMVNETAIDAKRHKAHNTTRVSSNMSECVESVHESADGQFAWSKLDQGLILSAYYWGYLITHVPGGWLAERWGSKQVLAISLLAQALPSFFIPLCAYYSPYAVIAMRVIQGMGAGSFYPACHTTWSKWAPPDERSRLVAMSYSGNQMGHIVTMPLSGLLCHKVGWQSVFYLFGSIAVFWFVLWMFLGYNQPSVSPFISEAEEQYIAHCLSESAFIEAKRKELGTPWKRLLTSKAVWAVIIAHTTINWGIYNLQTSIPTYMKEVLKFDIDTNGLVSALPYVCLWLIINLAAKLADRLLVIFRTVVVRKLMVTLGVAMPALFLIGMGFISCSKPYAVVILLCFGIGTLGFSYSGQMVNDLDIAYPFAGTILGIAYTFATVSGIVAPYLTQFITQHQTPEEWRLVFYINGIVYAIGLIVFLTMAEGTLQDWVLPYVQRGNDDKPDAASGNNDSPPPEHDQSSWRQREHVPMLASLKRPAQFATTV